jgi:SAM-dependent methyltransferase
MTSTTRYSYDNAWEHAPHRLRALEAWLDPGTERHLAARGIGPGWRCLEIGAGGGSIAAWLAEQVGPSGSVLATDIDTRHLERIQHRRLEVLQHDIVVDPLPSAPFDLVHARLVLAHLADPQRAFAHILAALKPGGWFVDEEMDFSAMAAEPSAAPAKQRLFEKLLDAHHRVTGARGFRHQFGRGLYGLLQSGGLIAVGVEAREFVCTAGSPGSDAWRLTFAQLGDEILASGLVDARELRAGIALADDPAFAFRSQLTVAAWGQRPWPPSAAALYA